MRTRFQTITFRIAHAALTWVGVTIAVILIFVPLATDPKRPDLGLTVPLATAAALITSPFGPATALKWSLAVGLAFLCSSWAWPPLVRIWHGAINDYQVLIHHEVGHEISHATLDSLFAACVVPPLPSLILGFFLGLRSISNRWALRTQTVVALYFVIWANFQLRQYAWWTGALVTPLAIGACRFFMSLGLRSGATARKHFEIFEHLTNYFSAAALPFSAFGLGFAAIILFFGSLFNFMNNNFPTYFDGVPSGTNTLWEFVYFSVNTVTTLGYSSIRPIHHEAQTLVSVEALVGIAWLSVGLGLTFAHVERPLAQMSARNAARRIKKEAIARIESTSGEMTLWNANDLKQTIVDTIGAFEIAIEDIRREIEPLRHLQLRVDDAVAEQANQQRAKQVRVVAVRVRLVQWRLLRRWCFFTGDSLLVDSAILLRNVDSDCARDVTLAIQHEAGSAIATKSPVPAGEGTATLTSRLEITPEWSTGAYRAVVTLTAGDAIDRAETGFRIWCGSRWSWLAASLRLRWRRARQRVIRSHATSVTVGGTTNAGVSNPEGHDST